MLRPGPRRDGTAIVVPCFACPERATLLCAGIINLDTFEICSPAEKH